MIEGRRVEYEPVLSSEPDSPQGHESFPYARFVPAKNGNYVEPNYMGYSDYGGSLVERSNVEEFIEQFADHQGTEWWELYGSHGTRAIIVLRDADERVPEIGEFFNALEDYPLANEERHSELEMEQRNEDWASYGRQDFARWLQEEKGGIKEVFVPYLRGVLAESYPKLDLIFDQLSGSVILQMTGEPEDSWGSYIDEAETNGALDHLWSELMHGGSGAAEEIEQHNTYFRFKSGFTDYYRDGHKGASVGEVVEFTEDAMKENAPEAFSAFVEWMQRFEKDGIGPQDQVEVLLDHLNAHGGEWDDAARKILEGRLGRYVR